MASALLLSSPVHVSALVVPSRISAFSCREIPFAASIVCEPIRVWTKQSARRGQWGAVSTPVVKRGVVCMATREEEKREGPHRFLRFAAGAGAATAAIGAAAWAVRKHDDQRTHHELIDEAIAAGAPPSAAAAGLGDGGSRGYTVQKGDTLTKIADRLGAPIQVIMEANGLRDDRVYAGQQLWVPKTYSIRSGDTLSKIARHFGTSVDVLSKLNGIKDPDLIFADDVLLLP